MSRITLKIVWITWIAIVTPLAFSETPRSQVYIERFMEFTAKKEVFGKPFTVPNLTSVSKGSPSKINGVYEENPINKSNLIKLLPGSPWVIHQPNRDSLTKDAKIQIEKAATDTIKQMDSAFKDNPQNAQEMGNLTLYREAAGRATKALWDHSLAELVKRKVLLATDLELTEATPDCQSAAQTPAAAAKGNIQARIEKCVSITNERWDTVTDIANEDPQVRDFRNQLQTMEKVGVHQNELQSNFNYQDSEFRTQHNGDLSNSEQLTEYNKSLERSLESLRGLQQMDPSISLDEAGIKASHIQRNTTHAIDLNRPTETLFQEFELNPAPREPTAETYQQLLEEHKQ